MLAEALLAFVGYQGAIAAPANSLPMSTAGWSKSRARSPQGRGRCCSMSRPPA